METREHGMIRLTAMLMVTIYIVLILVPGEDHGTLTEITQADGQARLFPVLLSPEVGAQNPRQEAPQGAARIQRSDLTDTLLQTAEGFAIETVAGELLEITAVIDPVALLHRSDQAPAVAVTVTEPTAPALAEIEEVEATPTADDRILWRVAGSRVNFRAGPSTNTAILTGLVQGDQVEFLADAPDGWAHLRILGSGQEGYMATRFLEPVN